MSEKDKKLPVKQSITQSWLYIKNALTQIPHTTHPIKAYLEDARLVDKYHKNTADVILTSPPYINVFNYHQNYRALIELFNFNILKVADSEFGSNRKNRGNRFRTVVQYCLDMEQAIWSFGNALKDDGLLILVLGRQSNVRSVPFYNGQIVADIIESTAAFREVNTFERQFINKFGNSIKEDILVFSKKNNPLPITRAREVAEKHLAMGLSIANQDLQQDIKAVMDTIQDIKASPLFNVKQITKHA